MRARALKNESFPKRALDSVLATIGLLSSGPLWLAVALGIKLEDGGPVFFRQERWGRGGKRFVVYKFRTMVASPNNSERSVQAIVGDPRITRIGRLLRATALDELPQLLNILKGDMSFVGPRALPINERQARDDGAEIADDKIAGFKDRLLVRPGLTGIAQVYAPRDVLRRHKFKYDLLYIRRWSFWLDIKLIVLSLWISVGAKWERENKARH
jgi:lipopolysaccharide/colanic/teichoic acid biosynthesis glycosyltransferase